LLRVSGREFDHHECLNCGFSDEPSPVAAIEQRPKRVEESRRRHEMPAGD
jgi:Zn ribbon nucleic-acid-binding protein